MEIELKYGRWQTTDGRLWKDLNGVDRLLFDVLIGYQKILLKYNLHSKPKRTKLEILLEKIGVVVEM